MNMLFTKEKNSTCHGFDAAHHDRISIELFMQLPRGQRSDRKEKLPKEISMIDSWR